MHRKLYWNTVTPLMKAILVKLMNCPLFESFRLVGGTALSLQLGHRISIDVDLFTDASYNSIDFNQIDKYLRDTFPYVSVPTPGIIGLGGSYFVGEDEKKCVKLDLYYTDLYIRQALIAEDIRMATIEEIIAMKIDVIQRGGRKKDFWDIHELLDRYPPDQMVILHKQRYPYGYDEDIIRSNLSDFSIADDDFEPDCLRGKYWELIKLDIIRAVKAK